MDLLELAEPARAQAVKNVKYELDAREAGIRSIAEGHAAELEKAKNLATVRNVEETLKTDLQDSEERASKELEAVIHASGTDFRRTFAEATDLLGADWPLVTGAVPRMPPTERRTNEVLAS
jgi:hypothetical protein